jgi:hypothetical protein
MLTAPNDGGALSNTTLSTNFNPNFHLESKVPFKVSQITDAHNLEAHFHL